MAIQKIQYDDKETINNDTSIPDKNKCKADDLNEIKSVVNNNADVMVDKSSVGTTTSEDTSLNFTNTLEAPINTQLKGNTSQTGTPTPSSPIPVNVVSGDNDIVVCGKNLFDINSFIDMTSTYRPNALQRLVLKETTNNSLKFAYNGGAYSQAFLEIEGLDGTKTYSYSWKVRDNTTNYSPTISKDNTNSDSTKLVLLISGGNGANNVSNTNSFVMYDIQIEEGSTATTYEAYNGTTYNIDLPVENLFDKNTMVINAAIDSGNGYMESSDNFRTIYIPCNSNTTYTISKIVSNRFIIGYTTDNNVNIPKTLINPTPVNTSTTRYTFTPPNNSKYVFIMVSRITDDTTNINDLLDSIQIEEGGKSNSYTPYGTTPIELNKIGTYQDYIYKENDKWYLHKEIGKVVLNGTENWNRFNELLYIDSISDYAISNNIPVCTHFKGISNVSSGNDTKTQDNQIAFLNSHQYERLFIYSTNFSTDTGFKTWLSTHNTSVYYVLATPTITEITYTPLIEQLDTIEQAQSKAGTTNITQVNNDLPFIINASVFNDNYNGRYESLLEMYKRLSNQ